MSLGIIELSWHHTSSRILLISSTLNGIKIGDTNTTPIAWDWFNETFVNRFFPIELREEKAKDFINLRKENMIVQ